MCPIQKVCKMGPQPSTKVSPYPVIAPPANQHSCLLESKVGGLGKLCVSRAPEEPLELLNAGSRVSPHCLTSEMTSQTQNSSSHETKHSEVPAIRDKSRNETVQQK